LLLLLTCCVQRRRGLGRSALSTFSSRWWRRRPPTQPRTRGTRRWRPRCRRRCGGGARFRRAKRCGQPGTEACVSRSRPCAHTLRPFDTYRRRSSCMHQSRRSPSCTPSACATTCSMAFGAHP
jgi:hypothetical protein